MPLQRLKVSGLRNLRNAKLDNCGRINILSGPNGSGKTSLLEAIYLLGMGRSFRSSRLAPIISHELDLCVVYGELTAGDRGGFSSLGLTRSRQGGAEFRINKAPATSAAELASALPVQIISADSFTLVDGGPKVRRQFMDWGVFHVKHGFLDQWRRAQRSLKQRNHLLRQRSTGARARIAHPDMAAWDKELAACSELIDASRAEYIEEIRPIFDLILQRLVSLPGLTIEYYRGWDERQSLGEALEQSFERDLRSGTTAYGPHRANLDIKVNGLPASEVLSRGQQKLVVSALRLAQGQYLTRQDGASCVYLIDDLPAELDKSHRATLCELLDEMGCQIFMTCVDADAIDGVWGDSGAVRRFHVERGQILCN